MSRVVARTLLGVADPELVTRADLKNASAGVSYMHIAASDRADNRPDRLGDAVPAREEAGRSKQAFGRNRRGATYICGELGAVEIGVSVRANPTPSLEGCADALWASECSSFPSALPTTVFGGIRPASFPPLVMPLGGGTRRSRGGSGVEAQLMMADRAMSECCDIPAAAAGM